MSKHLESLYQNLLNGKLPHNLSWSEAVELVEHLGEVQPHGGDEFVFRVGCAGTSLPAGTFPGFEYVPYEQSVVAGPAGQNGAGSETSTLSEQGSACADETEAVSGRLSQGRLNSDAGPADKPGMARHHLAHNAVLIGVGTARAGRLPDQKIARIQELEEARNE